MKPLRQCLLIGLSLGLSLITIPGHAADDPEVVYLLAWVAQSDCIFVRNGEEHPAVEASEHLAMKYRRVRRWIDDADEFIERIASGSSISGRPYLVRCPGQPEQPSGTWLGQELTQHREAPAD